MAFPSVGSDAPLGTTAIWFPIVNEIALRSSKIARAGSQERPPFVVRAKTVCERSAEVLASARRPSRNWGSQLRSRRGR
jgi:hypothetical protein